MPITCSRGIDIFVMAVTSLVDALVLDVECRTRSSDSMETTREAASGWVALFGGCFVSTVAV